MSVSKTSASSAVARPSGEEPKRPALLKVDSKLKPVAATPQAPTPHSAQQHFSFGRGPAVAPASFPEAPAVRGRSHVRERPVGKDVDRSSSKSPHRNRSVSGHESPARSGSRGRSASRKLDVMHAEQTKAHPQTSIGVEDAFPGLTAKKAVIHRSKLIEAIDRDDLEGAAKLMAAGESPFFGDTAFKVAHTTDAILLLLKGVDKFKLLSTCTKLDQACERIFPKVPHVDFLMLQQATRFSTTPALEKFEKAQKEGSKKPFNPQHLREALEKIAERGEEYNLVDLQMALSSTHPTFARAWACANEAEPIILVDDNRTYYSSEDNTIHIRVQDSLQGVLEDLFSCTLLALSRDSFLQLGYKPIDRETFTIKMSHAIFEAQQRSERELHAYFPDEPLSTQTFQEHWRDGQAEIQQHRDFWYRHLFRRFLYQNPSFLPARFEQMQKAIKA